MATAQWIKGEIGRIGVIEIDRGWITENFVSQHKGFGFYSRHRGDQWRILSRVTRFDFFRRSLKLLVENERGQSLWQWKWERICTYSRGADRSRVYIGYYWRWYQQNPRGSDSGCCGKEKSQGCLLDFWPEEFSLLRENSWGEWRGREKIVMNCFGYVTLDMRIRQSGTHVKKDVGFMNLESRSHWRIDGAGGDDLERVCTQRREGSLEWRLNKGEKESQRSEKEWSGKKRKENHQHEVSWKRWGLKYEGIITSIGQSWEVKYCKSRGMTHWPWQHRNGDHWCLDKVNRDRSWNEVSWGEKRKVREWLVRCEGG